MRVLWIGHFTPYPPRGGAPQRSYNLLKQAAARVELHFVGFSLPAHQPDRRSLLEAKSALAGSCASIAIRRERYRGSFAGKAARLALALASGRSYAETWLIGRAARELVGRAVLDVRPHVIHVDTVMIAGLLPSGWQGAAVLNHHNVESHMMARRAAASPFPLRRIFEIEAARLRDLERANASRFAEHLVVSRLDAERLRDAAPSARCCVIPNGVDVEYFHPLPVKAEPRTLVFAGRMNWYPNDQAMTRFLRELWPEVKRRVQGARLVVAGMNPTRSLLRAAAGDPQVAVTGFVEDIRPLIASAGLYVCPILDGGGTRLKVLDAMSMGKPMVATPLAVEGLDLVPDEEVLVREFGPEFVQAIVDAVERPDRLRGLGERARSRAVSSFAWERIGEQLVAAYARASSTVAGDSGA